MTALLQVTVVRLNHLSFFMINRVIALIVRKTTVLAEVTAPLQALLVETTINLIRPIQLTLPPTRVVSMDQLLSLMTNKAIALKEAETIVSVVGVVPLQASLVTIKTLFRLKLTTTVVKQTLSPKLMKTKTGEFTL